MSILAISINPNPYLTGTSQNGSSGVMGLVKNLADALQSGDLKSAQDAYTQIQSLLTSSQSASSSSSSSSSTSSSSTTTPSTTALQTTGTTAQSTQDALFSSDFAALGKALQAGDLSGAQNAFSKLGQDMQSTGKTHHHHHHHHHGAQSATQTSSAQSTTGTGTSSSTTGTSTGSTGNEELTITIGNTGSTGLTIDIMM